MSVHVIELNDRAVKVGDASGILVQSPGFALARGKELQLGTTAEQQARLHPTDSFNKYWHELSTEPLTHSHDIRHYADLAYAHLLHLAEEAGVDGEVLFAVPGNFTRQQLAILLGLSRATPFQPVGVINSALAAAIDVSESSSIVYADIQLHQVLLSRLAENDAHLELDSVVQVPGVGSQNFMDLMMKLMTDLFIRQCRFNPQHNAESEQQLYNQVPRWLTENPADLSSLNLELTTGATVYTAKLPRESLLSTLRPFYQKIRQQIDALAGQDTQLVISAALASLPGLTAALDRSPTVLSEDQITRSCLEKVEVIRCDDDAIHLVNRLPFTANPTPVGGGRGNDTPTHALYGNRAVAIRKIALRGDAQVNGSVASIHLAGDYPAELGCIECHDGQVYIDVGEQDYLLNDSPAHGRQMLKLGDRIQFSPQDPAITLIQVSNGG